MSNKNNGLKKYNLNQYDAKKIILGMLDAEKERQAEIRQLEFELSEEEKKGDMCNAERIKAIIQELDIIDPLTFEEESLPEENVIQGFSQKDNRKIPKKILRNIIIASALLIALAVSVAAARLGVFDGIENIKDLFSKKESTKIEKDGYDIDIASGVRTYDAVDELLNAEKVDILYPIVLPEDCYLQSISVEEYEYTKYRFIYSNGMTFRVNNSEQSLTIENLQILDYEVTVELCFTEEDSTYTAFWQYDGFNYELSCISKEDIIFILDNLFTK